MRTEPDRASNVPLESDLRMRFIEGLVPSAFENIFSEFREPILESLFSLSLVALSSDRFFAVFSSFNT